MCMGPGEGRGFAKTQKVCQWGQLRGTHLPLTFYGKFPPQILGREFLEPCCTYRVYTGWKNMSKYGHEIVSRRVIWVVYVWNNDMFLMMVIKRRKIQNKIYVLIIYICVYSEMKEWFSIFDIKREFLINFLILKFCLIRQKPEHFWGFLGGDYDCLLGHSLVESY